MKLFQILLVGFMVVVAGCAQVSVEPDEQGVIASDQQIDDSTVTIDTVTAAQDGWIVIHRDQNGNPGNVVGHARVTDGVNANIDVEIDTTQATPLMYAMLHRDTGNLGVYEFPGEDTPVSVNGSIVLDRFEVSGLNESDGTGNGELRIVEMRDIEFIPQTIEIEVGDTIRWENEDNVLHTLTGFGVDENVEPGETFSYTFDKAGEFDYVCTIHPGMGGTVIVRE